MNSLPNGNGCLICLSGGLDSTIAMRLAVEKYGTPNVRAVSFYYGQKQAGELTKAVESCMKLGVKHRVIDATFLGGINKGFCANVDTDIAVPDAVDVKHVKHPPTYVANRNMILLSILAAIAEVEGVQYIISGFQKNDNAAYHDCTPAFTQAINNVLSLNTSHSITVIAPFNEMSKADEIRTLLELDGDVDLLKHTLTCYNPTAEMGGFVSCGVCASCEDRLSAFSEVGLADPIPYAH